MKSFNSFSIWQWIRIISVTISILSTKTTHSNGKVTLHVKPFGHEPIQTQGSVHFKLQIGKITQEIYDSRIFKPISSQIPYLLIGMDHAKHVQLQIDAKQGYFKQDNQILLFSNLNGPRTKFKISFIQNIQCSKVMCNLFSKLQFTWIRSHPISYLIGTKWIYKLNKNQFVLKYGSHNYINRFISFLYSVQASWWFAYSSVFSKGKMGNRNCTMVEFDYLVCTMV